MSSEALYSPLVSPSQHLFHLSNLYFLVKLKKRQNKFIDIKKQHAAVDNLALSLSLA